MLIRGWAAARAARTFDSQNIWFRQAHFPLFIGKSAVENQEYQEHQAEDLTWTLHITKSRGNCGVQDFHSPSSSRSIGTSEGVFWPAVSLVWEVPVVDHQNNNLVFSPLDQVSCQPRTQRWQKRLVIFYLFRNHAPHNPLKTTPQVRRCPSSTQITFVLPPKSKQSTTFKKWKTLKNYSNTYK